MVAAASSLLAISAHAAAPGIRDANFTLPARPNYVNQPDGQMIYSWGYGCTTAGTGHTFNPSAAVMPGATCPEMQVPGPTLIVTQGVQFTVTLANALPAAAGNTSILFPGLRLVSATGGVPGILTQEAPSGSSASPVVYTLVADTPGTRAYYSGTQGDLQVEMGLYGSVIARPATAATGCPHHNGSAEAAPETDFRLAAGRSAYSINGS